MTPRFSWASARRAREAVEGEPVAVSVASGVRGTVGVTVQATPTRRFSPSIVA